jgi:hypothetical protein
VVLSDACVGLWGEGEGKGRGTAEEGRLQAQRVLCAGERGGCMYG